MCCTSKRSSFERRAAKGVVPPAKSLCGGETLGIARKVSHIVFDKTGTLTEGKISVVARTTRRS